ncbi:TonB-dependent receptor domain-containing protein, partial [Klebsiella pneumoniae]
VKTYALFAQDSISWNDWTFTPGLRYDYTRMEPHITDEFLRTMKQSQNTAVDESNKKWHRVSPKFGVTYDFAQHYTWYGQYAQGFRTPTAKALYGRFEN